MKKLSQRTDVELIDDIDSWIEDAEGKMHYGDVTQTPNYMQAAMGSLLMALVLELRLQGRERRGE